MTTGSWTGAERADAVRWFKDFGRTAEQIARFLDRTEKSVSVVLQEAGLLRSPPERLPAEPDAVHIARLALAKEIEMAKRERTTAPPYKDSRLEWR